MSIEGQVSSSSFFFAPPNRTPPGVYVFGVVILAVSWGVLEDPPPGVCVVAEESEAVDRDVMGSRVTIKGSRVPLNPICEEACHRGIP
jgi:hypothetical protein